jgi:hypothetical protein
MFNKLCFPYGKVLLGEGDFCDMGKEKANQLAVVFGTYLLGKK